MENSNSEKKRCCDTCTYWDWRSVDYGVCGRLHEELVFIIGEAASVINVSTPDDACCKFWEEMEDE